MGLLDKLAKQKPRESSGSRSANRFSFQVNWALSKLISLHQEGKPYLLVLDLHDDVVVANSEHAPSRIDFYQVKTLTKGEWSQAKLLGREANGKSLSILGKLYGHRITFPDHNGLLAFVSNARCDLPFAASEKEKPEIFFAHLTAKCKQEILKALRVEHSLDSDPECDGCMQFIVTDLQILNHSPNVRGRLSEFLDSIAPMGDYPVGAFYRAIADTMRRRNDQETLPTTVDDLIRRKAIARSEVEALLAKLTPVNRLHTLWNQLRPELIAAGLGIFPVKAMEAGWNKYSVDRQNPANKAAQKLQKQIRASLASIESRSGLCDLKQLLDAVVPLIQKVPKPYQGDYLKGAILLEFRDD